ncbi:MAG: hypothetical protein KF709_14710 [Gemmatimonadaceae bacterium]|nr:hypothetical protein [Gemmatimonadaceae bacterium]
MDRVTFATSSGLVWLVLALHFAAGLAAIVGGTIALAAQKGGALHRRSGAVFTWSMLGLGLSAAGIGAYEGNAGQVFAGLFAAYLVTTGFTALRPLPIGDRALSVGLMVLAFVSAATMVYGGYAEWADPSVPVVGRPRVVPPLVGGSILLLASLGDWRALRANGLRGAPRVARHLWRMCFGLFVATGSFFLGQMKFVPEPVRILPLMLVLAFAPIPFLLYWLWRVRIRKLMAGLTLSSRHAT